MCTVTIAVPPHANQPPFVLAGNIVRFRAAFTNLAGEAADPTSVTFSVGTSYADAISLTPVKNSVGHWHADWDATSEPAGDYYCVVSGTGTLVVEVELPVTVKVKHL